MRGVTLHASGTHEAEELLRVQREACLPALAHIYPPDLYPFPDAEVLARWRRFPGRVIVAEEDNTVVALAGVDDCWLHGFYVLPEYWGSGLADELHDAALDALRADGCTQAHLWVLEENHRARRFYERRGWRLTREYERGFLGAERAFVFYEKP